MKKMILAVLGSIAVVLSLDSCKKDTTLSYNNETLGNVVDGTFVSDNGNIYHIVEQNCAGKIDTMNRVYMISDILEKTEGGKDEEYNIRLNYLIEPLCKDMELKSELSAEDDAEMGNDPIHLSEGWFSGGYFNAIVYTEFEVGSEVKHLINVVVDDSKTDGKLHMSLRHNAYGETVSELLNDETKIVIGKSIVTFPIAKFMPEGKDELKVIVSYPWYESDSSKKAVMNEIEGTYTKGDFEHTPNEAKSIVKSVNIK